jgi:DNA replication protein DnaC
MDDELMKTLRYLRLRGLMAHWDEYLTLARQQHFSPVRLLRYVVEEESKIRQEHARQLRMARARIPELWRMETFPFERQPKLDKKRILSLYDALDYMTQNRNLIWVGPTGCGKTGLATGFLIQAIQRGYTGRRVCRVGGGAVPFSGRSFRAANPQALSGLRLPSGRRGRLRGSRTRSSRLVLHPDA